MLRKNSFPATLVDKCIKIFLNKQFAQKIVEHKVPKKEQETPRVVTITMISSTLASF